MVKSTKGERTKNRIIETAAELFFINGYNSTGVNDILRVTELPKGSFYFHFKSKKSLAIEVNFYFQKKLANWILETSKNKNWEEFITNLVDDMIEGALYGKYFGCPLTTLGQELAFCEPDIAKYYSDSLNKLICIFSSVLKRSGIDKEKIDIIANRAFILYEGYLVYYRISKNVDILRNMKNELISIYNQ
ncbi:TetR/AcrR family transcriptional regulator [Clostridium drakei]|uniref:TetR family transcriptional regulator n=1 Tax=Clostridium drakei TaxID=332101 RepID=A0A2U8DMC5_9CLOT|nr:TetR/AcrR family transcriptional regulator [Clostridium drakei]AWI03585.1 TetR family transcriptional regulator [Clostridium drakei]